MSSKVTEEQLGLVRQWAGQGVDLNGIQKKLASECGVHMTYMDVRFLLLDHGIDIARPQEEKPEKTPETAAPQEEAADRENPEGAPSGKPVVTLDDLQLPGALISGKVAFPGGAKGAWLIDQTGRFGWSDLSGSPSPAEMQDFQVELTRLLSRA